MYEVKRDEKALAKYFLSPSTQLAKYTAELGSKTIPVCVNSAANWIRERERQRKFTPALAVMQIAEAKTIIC
jgi:hypothetical protein